MNRREYLLPELAIPAANERQTSIAVTHTVYEHLTTGVISMNDPVHPATLNPPQIVSPDIRIMVQDDVGPGGAFHEYLVSVLGAPVEVVQPDGSSSTSRQPVSKTLISFQKGGIKEAGANGLTQEALLEIVRHRLACFQAGPFACRENESALHHVEDAIRWLNRRTSKRQRRGVEGKSVK